jgi:predicted flap endonuclease-1-like 5' DNA nuclease
MKLARNLIVLGFGLGVSAIVGWILLKENKKSNEQPTLTIKSQSRVTQPDAMPQIVLPLDDLEPETPVAVPAEENGDQDDLTQIAGIGPRFAEALRAVGITQFVQLAQETPDDLAAKLAAHVTVSAQRIQNNNWIGQAADLAGI